MAFIKWCHCRSKS